ncbi:MAG: galactokinase [Phycisphaerae bacterium]|nr:galactokinase [Phycisphaerae bacterium]
MPRTRASALFRQTFGGPPEVVAAAPGRVNLIGEHVDYAEGFVLPIAIERSTAVAIRRAPAGAPSRAVSEVTGEESFDLPTARGPLPSRSWANYVLGPMRELIDGGQARACNVDVAVASDVPLGGGVSSSAALEVAAALAYRELAGGTSDRLAIARLCQRAEHRYAGTPCGIMDMTVSACATLGHALLIDCRSLALRHVRLPASAIVLVFDSGVRHRLSDGGYASRRDAVERAADALGVGTLRDASPDAVARARDDGRLDADAAAKARHVTTEIARTIAAADALDAGDLAAFGRLMYESHASLRDDFRVSIGELDALVEAAADAPGVYGARMTGGGFGGSAIALVDRERADAAQAFIGDAFRRRFGRQPATFATAAAGGATVAPYVHG